MKLTFRTSWETIRKSIPRKQEVARLEGIIDEALGVPNYTEAGLFLLDLMINQ